MTGFGEADRSQILDKLTGDQRIGKTPIMLPVVTGPEAYGYTPGGMVYDSEVLDITNTSIPEPSGSGNMKPPYRTAVGVPDGGESVPPSGDAEALPDPGVVKGVETLLRTRALEKRSFGSQD